MKSFFGKLGEAARGRQVHSPVGFGTGSRGLPWRPDTGMASQMRAMTTVGTLYAIVHRLSNASSQVHWHLYEKQDDPDSEREEVFSHLALSVWQRPNRFYTTQEFVETFQQHLELTGEAWWVIGRAGDGTSGPPLELWPVRPDRMDPVPHEDDFLAGYVYRELGGRQVPLEIDQVIQLKTPHPLDPYRGLGPVAAIQVDLDSARFAAEWNRNFFINSAEPGGLIEVDRKLSDPEWRELVARWREQHQGVANAHRVAVVEQGRWVDRKYTMRDMQFPELRALSAEMIRLAYGFPKPLLGTVEDVNRANAEAAEVVFAKWLLVPRLERIKQALNVEFLPMFGPDAEGLEFDYDSPVLEDRAADRDDKKTSAEVVEILVRSGFDAAGVLEWAGLPDLAYAPAVPSPAPAPATEPPTEPESDVVEALFRAFVAMSGDQRAMALMNNGNGVLRVPGRRVGPR